METKTSHTPGPWKYDGEFVSARVQPSNAHYPGDTVPATICELSPFPEWEANARLIAAAPELLAALKVGKSIKFDRLAGAVGAEWVEQMNAAILRATEGK